MSRKRRDLSDGLFGTKVAERDECRADDSVVGIPEELRENRKRLFPKRERAVTVSQLTEHVSAEASFLWVTTGGPSSALLKNRPDPPVLQFGDDAPVRYRGA